MEKNNIEKDTIAEALAQRRSKGKVLIYHIELELLKYLPIDYKLEYKDSPTYLLIQISFNASSLKSSPLKIFQFDILVSQNYPISPPKIRTVSSVRLSQVQFGNPSLADGRDLLIEIIKKKWTTTTTLFETIIAIPGFIVFIFIILDEIFRRKQEKRKQI